MLHRCSIVKESRQSWSWNWFLQVGCFFRTSSNGCHTNSCKSDRSHFGPWVFEVLGMFGRHHVHHNVPLGFKFIEDSDLCGQMIFWWNCWRKVEPLLVWMEDLGDWSGDRHWNKVYIHKRQIIIPKQLWTGSLDLSLLTEMQLTSLFFVHMFPNEILYHRLDRFMSSVISVVATSKVCGQGCSEYCRIYPWHLGT